MVAESPLLLLNSDMLREVALYSAAPCAFLRVTRESYRLWDDHFIAEWFVARFGAYHALRRIDREYLSLSAPTLYRSLSVTWLVLQRSARADRESIPPDNILCDIVRNIGRLALIPENVPFAQKILAMLPNRAGRALLSSANVVLRIETDGASALQEDVRAGARYSLPTFSTNMFRALKSDSDWRFLLAHVFDVTKSGAKLHLACADADKVRIFVEWMGDWWKTAEGLLYLKEAVRHYRCRNLDDCAVEMERVMPAGWIPNEVYCDHQMSRLLRDNLVGSQQLSTFLDILSTGRATLHPTEYRRVWPCMVRAQALIAHGSFTQAALENLIINLNWSREAYTELLALAAATWGKTVPIQQFLKLERFACAGAFAGGMQLNVAFITRHYQSGLLCASDCHALVDSGSVELLEWFMATISPFLLSQIFQRLWTTRLDSGKNSLALLVRLMRGDMNCTTLRLPSYKDIISKMKCVLCDPYGVVGDAVLAVLSAYRARYKRICPTLEKFIREFSDRSFRRKAFLALKWSPEVDFEVVEKRKLMRDRSVKLE